MRGKARPTLSEVFKGLAGHRRCCIDKISLHIQLNTTEAVWSQYSVILFAKLENNGDNIYKLNMD